LIATRCGRTFKKHGTARPTSKPDSVCFHHRGTPTRSGFSVAHGAVGHSAWLRNHMEGQQTGRAGQSRAQWSVSMPVDVALMEEVEELQSHPGRHQEVGREIPCSRVIRIPTARSTYRLQQPKVGRRTGLPGRQPFGALLKVCMGIGASRAWLWILGEP